ncbi:MAG: cell division protein FtsL [Acidobacteria bacterium]|nr:cell division protein FtsL [Acidobacteriota bacterium]
MAHAETFEYQIRKDVRNNPIVREFDERRQRELWSSLVIGAVLVLVVMFDAWQHFEHIRHGYALDGLQKSLSAEDDVRRHLRLEIETLRAPQRIERIAVTQLGMIQPKSGDAIVLERVLPAEPPARSVVASR